MSGPSSDLDTFCNILSQCKCLALSTGAGLSAGSGVPTYRGVNGQWTKINPMDVVSLQAFTDNPGRVWAFFHPKRDKCIKAEPNAAHHALASLSIPSVRRKLLPNLIDQTKSPLYITQNFDGLCRRALDTALDNAEKGGEILEKETQQAAHERLIEIHGSCYRFLCTQCKALRTRFDTPLADIFANEDVVEQAKNGTYTIAVDQLPRCGGSQWSGSNRYGQCGGLLRPAVTWFGEIPEGQGEVVRNLTKVDVLLVIGTTSLVHPAASYATTVKKNGGIVAVFNLGETHGDDKADFAFYGPCEETIPKLLERLVELNAA